MAAAFIELFQMWVLDATTFTFVHLFIYSTWHCAMLKEVYIKT